MWSNPMHPELAIEVENLAKRYYVGHLLQKQVGTRAAVVHTLTSPFRRLGAVVRGQSAFGSDNELWALKDVSFEVKKGDIVGIIGTNGSGKSTLLKILSRVTVPTSGVARLNGEVGSLLEVGTGFHPELTGRENVYLNGAILGMTRGEIARAFDAIVDFSGVEAFIDTPVKRYSSGMRVRLAFAVAAFLRPEIIMIDEVLAVGDAAFQRRGLAKVSNVAREGRTVLMVTHNMSAVLSNATWVMWLDKGRIVEMGTPQTVVARYLKESTIDSTQMEGEKYFNGLIQAPDVPFEMVAMRTLDEHGDLCSNFLSSMPITVELEFKLKGNIPRLRVGLDFKTSDDLLIFRSFFNDDGAEIVYQPDMETYRLRAQIPPKMLNSATYSIDPIVNIPPGKQVFTEARGLVVNVIADTYNKGLATRGTRVGVIAPVLAWTSVHEKV